MLSLRRALAVMLSLGFLAALTACTSLLWAQADQAPAQPAPRGQAPPPPAVIPAIGNPQVLVPGVRPAAGGNTMPGKMDVLRNVLLEAANNAGTILNSFTAADTLTVTITQP